VIPGEWDATMALDAAKLLFRRFSPLEERLLAAIRKLLPPAARPMYDAQVLGVTRVQRHPRWTEIIFYRIRKRTVDWSDVPSFPCSDEFRLAEVRFSARGKNYRATLMCVRGHIAILTVAPSPKQVAFEPWDGEASVQILNDPLSPAALHRHRNSVLPAWREFLLEHPDKTSEGWILYDEVTAYRVPSDDGEWLVVAVRNGDEYILQELEAEGETVGKLLYLSNHDGEPEPIDGDLAEFVKRTKPKTVKHHRDAW
jgi:hypothetical protein